jgi:PPOX class probable F420-dependent enzyme
VLATYRADGDVLLSPVWHRWRDGGFEMITGKDDVKARHLRRGPRASVVVYGNDAPYQGVEVRGRAVLGPADPDYVRAMAIRYLGQEVGAAYEASSDTLIRLEPGSIRIWDFAD